MKLEDYREILESIAEEYESVLYIWYHENIIIESEINYNKVMINFEDKCGKAYLSELNRNDIKTMEIKDRDKFERILLEKLILD